MWVRAGLHRAGAPTPPTAGVCGQGVLHAQTRKGMCDPHSLEGDVCAHTSVGSVTEAGLGICSCMLTLVAGIVVICYMADINPECIVQ